jgi:hypothetical protein
MINAIMLGTLVLFLIAFRAAPIEHAVRRRVLPGEHDAQVVHVRMPNVNMHSYVTCSCGWASRVLQGATAEHLAERAAQRHAIFENRIRARVHARPGDGWPPTW